VARGQDDEGGAGALAVATLSTARQVAEALRLWAAEHNLLRRGAAPPLASRFIPIDAITMPADAVGVLERQAITAFGISDRQSRVYVYTNKRITKAQSNILPDNVYGDVEIIYKQARPIVVGNEEEDPIVGVSPYYIVDGRYTCGSSIGVGIIEGQYGRGTVAAAARGTMLLNQFGDWYNANLSAIRATHGKP
jgi:hypothetical protein